MNEGQLSGLDRKSLELARGCLLLSSLFSPTALGDGDGCSRRMGTSNAVLLSREHVVL